MNGDQCFGSLTDIYDVAGGIRNGFIALQDALRAQQDQMANPASR